MHRRRNLVLLLGVGVLTLAVYAVSFGLSTTRDRKDQLDTDVLRSAAGAACNDLRAAVDAQPALAAGAGSAARTARVQQQVDLVTRFAAQVRAVGPAALDADVPSRDWVADWEALAASRQAYARAGFRGAYAVPVEDGQPITRRMAAIGVEACSVPTGLTASP